MPNVSSTRDLVSRPDNMDEPVPHPCEKTKALIRCAVIGHFQSIKTDVLLNFLKTTNTIRIG